MRQHGRRRQGGDTPAGRRGGWFQEQWVVVPAAAPEGEADRARMLCRQLQAARGGQGQAAGQLADDAGQAGVAQRFLHALLHGRGPGRLGVDDAVCLQADRIEGGKEQIGALQQPEDGAGAAGEDACDQQCRGGAMLDVRAAAGDLMQGAQGEAAAGQVGIDGRHPEREGSAQGPCRLPDPGDAGLQRGQTGRCRMALVHHGPCANLRRGAGNI